MRNLSAICVATALLFTLSESPARAQDKPVGERMSYKSVGERTLSLYVLKPAHPAPKAAAVLFFHGGGWINGGPWQFNTQATAVAEHGAVAVEVEYRLLDKIAGSAEPPRICVEDTKSAIRWVRSHAVEFGIDPNRIAAAGGSAGGYDAAYAALVPGWDAPGDDLSVSAKPNALVLLNPVLDVRPGQYGNARFAEDAKARSPIAFVTKSAPPTLILSGTADRIALPDTLRKYERLMKAAGGRCEVIFYDGQIHAFFSKQPYLEQTTAEMVRFLFSLGYLQASSAAPKASHTSPA